MSVNKTVNKTEELKPLKWLLSQFSLCASPRQRRLEKKDFDGLRRYSIGVNLCKFNKLRL